MNTAATSSIETSVADLYLNRKTLRDMDEEDRARSNSRASLGLAGFIKPFVLRGGNFLRMLWQAIVALVRKVASAFRVDVDVPEAPPGPGAQAMADFRSQDESPEGAVAVQAAATESAKDLSALVSQIISRQADKDRLCGSEGVAYASLNLQEIGSAVLDAREELSRADVVLNAAAASAAASCGSSVESMKALLDGCSFNQPGLEDVITPDIQDMAKRRAQLQSELCSLRLKFSEFSIAGLVAAREIQQPKLEESIKSKVFQFADQEMAELIFSRGLSEDAAGFESSKIKFTSPKIESEEIISSAVASVDSPAPAATLSRRRSWSGMSAGIVDDCPEEDGDASSRVLRER